MEVEGGHGRLVACGYCATRWSCLNHAYLLEKESPGKNFWPTRWNIEAFARDPTVVALSVIWKATTPEPSGRRTSPRPSRLAHAYLDGDNSTKIGKHWRKLEFAISSWASLPANHPRHSEGPMSEASRLRSRLRFFKRRRKLYAQDFPNFSKRICTIVPSMRQLRPEMNAPPPSCAGRENDFACSLHLDRRAEVHASASCCGRLTTAARNGLRLRAQSAGGRSHRLLATLASHYG